jgi:hypothetical protein
MIMKIENFAELSAQEQRAFADALIKTINSEHTFSSEIDFEITDVEADELTGNLWIGAIHKEDTYIEVVRQAHWQAADEDEAYSAEDPEYYDSIYNDAKASFKTMESVIEGYKVSLSIDDVDEVDTVDTTADDISHEDSGIGSYEYWGESGYDSNEYVEVDGTITVACECAVTFTVEPVSEAPATEEIDEE